MKTSDDLTELQGDFLRSLNSLGVSPYQLPQIVDNLAHSLKTCGEISRRLQSKIPAVARPKVAVVLMGSYGRLEASPRSDVDYVLLTTKRLEKSIEDAVNKATRSIVQDFQEEDVVLAPDRLFGKVLSTRGLTSNIGGTLDTNDGLTSRMLLLLESLCVFNPTVYREVWDGLWNAYTHKILEARKPPQLLINEVLRYYRTLCLDYKYKIDVQGKPWGIRNIKLRHSRKLLCFSTMLLILDSIHEGRCDFDYLKRHLNSPPLFKLADVMARHEMTGPIDPLLRYDTFLRALSDGEGRKRLVNVRFDTREKEPLYVTLRKNSYDMEDGLSDILTRLGTEMQKKVNKFFVF